MRAVGGDSLVSVSWDVVPEASSYTLYWSRGSGVSPATGTPIPAVASPYLHTGLGDGGTINVRSVLQGTSQGIGKGNKPDWNEWWGGAGGPPAGDPSIDAATWYALATK